MTRELIIPTRTVESPLAADRPAMLAAVLAPWRMIAASGVSNGSFLAPLWRDISALPGRDTEAAKRILRTIASMPSLAALRDQIVPMLSAPPDYDRTFLLVASTLDAFPNARVPNAEMYMSTAAMDLTDAGHGLEVVARGLQLSRKATKFAPTIAEMLAGCISARGELTGALAAIAMLEKAATRARTLCAESH